MEVQLALKRVGSCKREKMLLVVTDNMVIGASREQNGCTIICKAVSNNIKRYEANVRPPTGTIASEWSELFMWKPRIYLGVETMAKDSYCSQREPS